jgi:polyisoprenoid-binding protein YceI
MHKRILSFFILAFFAFQAAAWAEAYKVDLDHTSVSFKIRHLFSKVQGSFKEFDGKFEYDPAAPEKSTAEAVVQAASIDTNVAQRDKHLKSADFLDVEKYPVMTFKSTGIKDATAESAKLHGLLTIHGVERPVVFDLEILGVGKDPWGNERAAFTANTTINRKDFGLNWNQAVETGQLLVGEEVEITIEAEGIKQ